MNDTLHLPFLQIQNEYEKQSNVNENKSNSCLNNDTTNIAAESAEYLKHSPVKTLFKNDYSKPCITYNYPNPYNNQNFDTREFRTPGELIVRDRIYETFNSYYHKTHTE